MNDKIPASPSLSVEVKGLTKLLGNRHVLRNVDFSINRGENLVVFGPNGAGKTTLVKILATLLRPSSGDIWIDGIDIREKAAQIRQRISLVTHQTFLYDNLTVYENLKFYGKMYSVLDLEQRIQEVIAWVNLESRLNDKAGTLSHGMQRRASIARSILHNPSILFLDEPEVGLDPQAVTLIKDILGDINASGRTVVMTTHNLAQGLELADSVIILNRGQIVYRAARQEISEDSFQQIYDRCTETG